MLGCWSHSPRGPFADVMVQDPSGVRTLLAPDTWVAEFVSATYTFDQVLEVPLNLERTGTARGSQWSLTAGPLSWEFTVGARHRFGHVLRALPKPLGRTRTFAQISDTVARRAMPGVRTLGSAGNNRREWYAARDLHHLSGSCAWWDGADLGDLRDVDPPASFGFGSTPRQPCLTALTTTVEIRGGPQATHPSGS